MNHFFVKLNFTILVTLFDWEIKKCVDAVYDRRLRSRTMGRATEMYDSIAGTAKETTLVPMFSCDAVESMYDMRVTFL